MTKSGKTQSPYQKVIQHLDNIGATHLCRWIPKKWEKVGHVIVLRYVAEIQEFEKEVGNAFIKVFPDVDVVVVDGHGVQGELRQPTSRVVMQREGGPCSGTTEVLHVENGVKYKWDVLQIMFSSGNTKERIRFRREVKAKDEIVVDMFAGLGYFSIPLAMATAVNRPRHVYCIEKNPTSHHYLKENVQLNKVGETVTTMCGDNREVGEELLGTANRVLMGYLPTPVTFLPRAYAFLDPLQGGVIHYHYTATKAECVTLPAQHVTEMLGPLGVVVVSHEEPGVGSGTVAGDLDLAEDRGSGARGGEARTEAVLLEGTVDEATCVSQPLGPAARPCPARPVVCTFLKVHCIKSYCPQVFHWIAEMDFRPHTRTPNPTCP